MIDLFVSVADSLQEDLLNVLLPRVPKSLLSGSFTFNVKSNPHNDSGSFNDSHEFLRPFINKYSYAIIIFDYEGSGIENSYTREEAEAEVERLLSKNGWEGRNSVIAIDPEIENWMWLDSPHVQNAMGWENAESLYTWARKQNLVSIDQSKPTRPKESFEKALKFAQTAKSASIYKKIAQTVSFKKCEDPAFLKLLTVLKNWFPPL